MINIVPTTILFKKEKNGSPIRDMVDDFDVALIDINLVLSGGTKDVYVNDWKDEDGEEVFFPDKLRLKPYDMTITFGVKDTVDDYISKWRRFDDYITGRDGTGTAFSFYSPWFNIGRQHCYVKDYKEKESYREIGGSAYHTFDRTIRVTDPATFVKAVLDDGNKIVFIPEKTETT